MSDLKYTINVEGNIIKHKIVWLVKDFFEVLECKKTRELCADKSMDPTADPTMSAFQLNMRLLGYNKDIIEIYCLPPAEAWNVHVILNVVYTGQERSVPTKEFTSKLNTWQHLATLFKFNIIGNQGNTRLISTNFRCVFQFTVKNDLKVNQFPLPEAQLSLDLQLLLLNEIFPDVTIKSAEGKEFHVHKGLLASRSPVLKAHFDHNTTECHTNIIETPFDTNVLKEVLTFIYSAKAPRVAEMAEKLLAAADYYQLNHLKSLCEDALLKKLTVENAIETLQLADLHSANGLKQLILDFFKHGQARLIIKTNGWAKLQSVDLIKTICEQIVDDI